MSTTTAAVTTVLLASTVANNNSSNNNEDTKGVYCNQVMPKFNPKVATIEQKQEYASCVDHFYPVYSNSEIITIKIIIALMMIIYVVSVFVIGKHEGYFWAICLSLLVSLVAGIIICAFTLGFLFLFS